MVFDATRRSDGEDGALNPDGLRGPALRVHVDYTVKSGPQRVADILGEDEAERLAENGARIVQVNVWRPISGPVRRSPLALADASSVGAGELIATDQVFPDRIGEIYQIAHASTQRWYYAPEIAPDEVLLIKGWDSIDDGRARFTPARRLLVRRHAGRCAAARKHRGPGLGRDRERQGNLRCSEQWWARLGLNQRPLACEASALPLSYAPKDWRVYGSLLPGVKKRPEVEF